MSGSVAKNLEGGDGREGFFLASFTLPLETVWRYMQLDPMKTKCPLGP